MQFFLFMQIKYNIHLKGGSLIKLIRTQQELTLLAQVEKLKN